MKVVNLDRNGKEFDPERVTLPAELEERVLSMMLERPA